ncbi:MAG: FGGY-family carbohydrate kinase, partial [Hyphomicrobiales bacterium]|nr:FGGY-family carbohydrate kinase [Hyphomicrobiales bacterium]
MITDAEEAGPVLIGIDIGTTSVRAIAFDARGRKLAVGSRKTPIEIVETGGECDPDRIWACVEDSLAEVGAGLAGRPVAGLAVASIGESAVVIDQDGAAVTPSIIWYDRRTVAEAAAIAGQIGDDRVFRITGLPCHHIATLPKLMWMQTHWSDAMARARHVLLMADWVAFRLTGEMATDPSLASRTLFFDLGRRQWSEEMLDVAGLRTSFPAPISASGRPLGVLRRDVATRTGLAGRPVVAVGGHDHVLGAFATGLSRPGTVTNSIGTAEGIFLATPRPVLALEAIRRGYEQGAIETASPMSYLGASQFCSGGAVEWVRTLVGGMSQEDLTARAEAEPVGSGGAVFLPHLVNSPPPEPDPHGRGAFVGLTLQATPPRLYRAVLEGLAMQSRRSLDGMTDLPGVESPREIRLIGGASRNRLLLSIRANVFGRSIIVVEEPEPTALGAALLGGVAAGLFPSLEAALPDLDRSQFVVEPDGTAARYEHLRTMVFADIHARLRPVN